jgi:hypothetical protein
VGGEVAGAGCQHGAADVDAIDARHDDADPAHVQHGRNDAAVGHELLGE